VKRILFVHNVYRSTGGEETSLSILEKALQDNDWTTECYERHSTDYLNSSRLQRVRQAIQIAFSVDSYMGINRVVQNFKPDLLFVHNLFPFITPSIYWAASRHHIPVVHMLHNYRLLCVNGLLFQKGLPCERCVAGNVWNAVSGRCYGNNFLQSLGAAINLWIHRWYGTWHKKVDAFIALSQFSKTKFIEGGLPADKIHVLPNWIDVNRYAFRPEAEEESLVFLGRLSQEKGILTLLHAHAIFSKTYPATPLHVVGDGPLSSQVTSYIQAHPEQKIVYHGRLEGEPKLDLLSRAAALVFPSECYENCPYTILESFAVGTPVLASRIGGIPELVSDQKTGYLFQPGDSQSIADCLSRFFQVRNTWVKLRQQARNEALHRFNRREGIERLERLFAIITQSQYESLSSYS
jgi:glycosyltransferase involved in cell wall biosynthesis